MAKTLLGKYFSIQASTDVERTVSSITTGTSLKGFNVWILICSSLLASIGLDVNSTAVIIGAMLISPLMSPILGIGLSLGMHDRDLFLRALRNLAVATFISLLASTLYFLITPLGDITSELEARTRPTLLDVMVALFGGIAGIVSISRKDNNNAIPGVAIATALMPPLCTAGFGIASGQWMYFLGAFYLFFINAVFISLSTYLIVKYLKFPVKEYVDERTRKRYARISGFFVVLVMLPSIYFLVSVYRQLQLRKKVENIVVNPISSDGNEILKWEMDRRDSITDISVYYSGRAIAEGKRAEMEEACRKNGVENCELHVMRVNMTKEEITGLSEATARRLLEDMEVKMAQQKLGLEDSVNELQKFSGLHKEVMTAFEFIDSIWLGETIVLRDSSRTDTFMNAWYQSARRLRPEQQGRLYEYLKMRLAADTIVVNRI
jgi:uncharacterized hydrophobic protein (TIGR00271 family)